MKNSAEHIERALDDALNLTFPASDPVAVFLTAAPASFDRESFISPSDVPPPRATNIG